MKTPEQIAQWVIYNRYPKSEFEKVDDFEMFHTVKDDIQAYIDQVNDIIAKYKERIGVINSNYKSTDWNNTLKDLEIETLENVIEDLQQIAERALKITK